MYELIIYVDAFTYAHRNVIEQVRMHSACMRMFVRKYSEVRLIVLVTFSLLSFYRSSAICNTVHRK
jgi:hypothetical protein